MLESVGRLRTRPATLARRALAAVALALAVCAPLRVPAQGDETVDEYAVKAAYLYAFAGYVQWPATALADAPAFRIGVAGAPAVARELADRTADKLIEGRPIDVVELEDAEAVDELDILFVGRLDEAQLEDYLAAVNGEPVLTVTELDDALERGVMINFLIVADNVRFEVSLPAAERSSLRVNARMLSVAERVLRRSGRR